MLASNPIRLHLFTDIYSIFTVEQKVEQKVKQKVCIIVSILVSSTIAILILVRRKLETPELFPNRKNKVCEHFISMALNRFPLINSIFLQMTFGSK